MYHCHIHFHFTGRRRELLDFIKKMPAPEYFSYGFSESDEPDRCFIPTADVIFANLQEMDADALLHTLISGRKKDSELILLAQPEQIRFSEELLNEAEDIWLLPMPEEEMRFRFLKWQRSYKKKMDSWETSHFLDAVINNSPNLIWYKTKDGIHEKVNESFCRTVNKTRQQVEGRGHAYIWNVEHDDPACIDSEEEVMRRKETCVTDEVIETGDGPRLLTTYKSPLYDLDGSVMGTVGLAIDVTQERAYEQELIRKNQMLETIFSSTECGVMCHTTDGSQIISINRAALRILGYESQEEMMADGFDMVAGSVIDEDKITLQKAILSLQSVDDSTSVEYQVLHQDGQIIHVMGNIKLMEENGERFYQRFLLDCTAQKLREKEESKKKDMEIEYRQKLFDIFSTYLASNMDDVYMMLNEDLATVEYISPNVERILGVSRNEVAEDLNNLGRARYLGEKTIGYEELKQMKPGTKFLAMETERINRKTGERKYFRESIYSVIIQNVNKLIIYISDRTRERQTQDVLTEALELAQEANKAKSAFLSNVSHDIRTPMNVIMGLVTLLKEESHQPERVLEYTQKISAASQHLLGLINDVLDMNKIESGKTTLNISQLDLAEVISDLNTIIRPQTRTKKQTFDISTASLKNEHLLGDKLRINQILINILSNAVKYTQEGGRIFMKVEELPQIDEKYSCIQFTISDNGQGMSEEYQNVIFNPFTREQESTINQVQGTGLGMAITKSLVDLMNGSIQVQSELGRGSTFTVRLELRIQEEERKDTSEFWKKNGFLRMLIMDRDEETCKNVIKTMSGTGVAMEFSTDRQTSLDMIRQAHQSGKPYNLILMDWNMPGLRGQEADRLLKKEYPHNTPVLLFTAYDWQEIEKEALDIGIDHFLPKPFFISNLRDTVEQIMGKSLKPVSDSKANCIIEGMNILVVDDIEINRMILVKILEKLGATTDTAANGQEAADKFENSQPGEYDVILMDIQMPIMNGYEATRVIRTSSHPSAKKVAVIAMTANAFIDDVHDALESGMDAHIAKPVVVDQLKATIGEVMRVKEELK